MATINEVKELYQKVLEQKAKKDQKIKDLESYKTKMAVYEQQLVQVYGPDWKAGFEKDVASCAALEEKLALLVGVGSV